MVSVTEAKQLIAANSTYTETTTVSLKAAAGLVLAADIVASADIPAYPQSSMDGYAFRYADWRQDAPLEIQGEMAAGSSTPIELRAGQAARIFTGAPVPAGADTVAMQEKTTVQQHSLYITDDQLQKGNHVRPAGSEIAAGATALKSGSLLTPAAIGFLAGIGITEVQVYKRPRISILVTGNELQPPGRPLAYGQVYESNSYALTAVLQQLGFAEVQVAQVADNFDAVQQTIGQLLEQSTVLLITGGVSVGDYDFVAKALAANGVETLFHRVKQKPGKPLYFGKKQQQWVFGLPGNPSSVLTCFYEYVLPALDQMLHKPQRGLPVQTALLSQNCSKKAGLTHFLKAQYANGTVTPLDAQESYRMRSFALANCLICLGENDTSFNKGDTVTIHVLPFC